MFEVFSEFVSDRLSRDLPVPHNMTVNVHNFSLHSSGRWSVGSKLKKMPRVQKKKVGGSVRIRKGLILVEFSSLRLTSKRQKYIDDPNICPPHFSCFVLKEIIMVAFS